MKISDILGVQNRPKLTQFLGESLAGCWVVAIITFSGYVLHFDSAPVGFLLLLDAVSVAILCGFWQATLVSVLACACLDFFFYPPLLTFRISDPRDWVALGAFEISALVVSRLSSREQRSTFPKWWSPTFACHQISRMRASAPRAWCASGAPGRES